jgi:hypothetical protein
VAAQILMHMARSQREGRSAPDAPPPEQVFRDLLSETLLPALERQPAADIEAAKRVMGVALTTIETEIFLVPPPPPAKPRRRSSHRKRR